MRTVVTKTKNAQHECKKMVEGAQEEDARFFDKFLEEEMHELEQELFPIEELHIGELNPIIGKRILQQKLSKLKYL